MFGNILQKQLYEAKSFAECLVKIMSDITRMDIKGWLEKNIKGNYHGVS